MNTLQIVNGDAVLNSATGRPRSVTETEKLRQDVTEILNLDAPTGAGISSSKVIGLIGDPFSLRAELSGRINSAFARYQQAQQNTQRASRTSKETFGAIRQLVVTPVRTQGVNRVSKTTYAYQLDVVSLSQANVAVAQAILT